ncbi:MAG: type II secretion system F family protein [Oscillospiraceae bacterium]|nr:type II secretion system F family protein [Oscillospiraceae bacterium]
MKPKELTNEQICAFCTALEHLIQAGIGLGDALVLMKEGEQEAANRQMLAQMALRADEGAALSAVIRESGKFPGYVSTMIEVGERTGKTEQTLAAVVRYYEGRSRMDRYLRSALVYPASLLGVLLAVVLVLLIWVLPVFNDVYSRLGSSLTGVAGGLLMLGNALRKGMPVICGVIVLIGAFLVIKPLRGWILGLWSRIRGDCGVHRKVLSARFVQSVSMAVSSGMSDLQALELACTLADGEGAAFRNRCEKCRAAVENSKSLQDALYENDFLTASDRRLLHAGTRSGKGEAVLQKISEDLLEQSEEALERRTGRVEPIVVAVACVLIGTVLLSVMLPLMHIMTAIG